jgi:hypothetical protein
MGEKSGKWCEFLRNSYWGIGYGVVVETPTEFLLFERNEVKNEIIVELDKRLRKYTCGFRAIEDCL